MLRELWLWWQRAMGRAREGRDESLARRIEEARNDWR